MKSSPATPPPASHGRSPLWQFVVPCGQVLPPSWDEKTLTLARSMPVLRSEEHTSELQSQSNLVCRLLLEKKKKKRTRTLPSHIHSSIRTDITPHTISPHQPTPTV